MWVATQMICMPAEAFLYDRRQGFNHLQQRIREERVVHIVDLVFNEPFKSDSMIQPL